MFRDLGFATTSKLAVVTNPKYSSAVPWDVEENRTRTEHVYSRGNKKALWVDQRA